LAIAGLFLSVVLLQSCKNSNCSRIVEKLSDFCPWQSVDCFVRLEDVVQKDWDYVFIASETLSLEEINKHLGFKYPYFEDIGKKIIFVKENKVVYYEDFFPYVDKKRSCELLFEFKDDRFYIKMKREDAVFKVFRKGGDFLLSPLAPPLE
jgi:hypothetical protein